MAIDKVLRKPIEAGLIPGLVAVAANDPHHVVFFEVYDNAAALEAHQATDHFKKFMAATKDMVAKRDARAFTSVAMNSKGK